MAKHKRMPRVKTIERATTAEGDLAVAAAEGRRDHSSPTRLGAVKDEHGFTLIELLAVILIIAILAAIAIPAFLSQTSRASDSAAETQVGTLRTAMQAYASDNDGSFVGATVAKLQTIEPTLKDTSTAIAKEVGSPTATGFTVESEAVGTKHLYKIVSTKGEVVRECATAGKGGCSADGTW
jgi:type IV pilus assembly protein PilA